MANLTDADKVIRNDVGKSIASKLDDIADAIVAQGGGAHSLGQLSDVNIDTQTLAAGQILEYDDNDGKWKNVANPASTTNFGAPYDENTTYNVPSLVIYNNLLYKLNDGEDGTTGPWDPTKWTQTSVAELASLIGSLSTLTTTDKSSIVGAVNEVNSYKSGDTITFNFQQLFCRIDASGKRISVFIPLNKKIPSTATVTASGNYSVYYYDGSSLLSNHDIANDTQSIQNTPIGIVLTITLTNALPQTLGYGAVELRNTFTLTFS